MSETPDSENVDSTETTDSLTTMAIVPSYKVLGQFTDHQGAGVLGRNDAGSGTPIGVQGVVPNSNAGYGLATPDDLRLEGIVDTNGTDFLVEDGSGGDINVVLGSASNEVRNGASRVTVAGGGSSQPNLVYDDTSTIAGGMNNQIGTDDSDTSSARQSFIGSGKSNDVTGVRAVVGGGLRNTASGLHSSVGGGNDNIAGGSYATVAGGNDNVADDFYAVVAGGSNNKVLAEKGAIAGGGWTDTDNRDATANAVLTDFGFVGGGGNNVAGASGSTTATYATVGGGEGNNAKSQAATIGGGQYNDANANHATIAGGGSTDDTESTGNVVYDEYGTVGGGGNNAAGASGSTTASYATVAGGENNNAGGGHSVVGGGLGNNVEDSYTTIGGGRSNKATMAYATVAGGDNNEAKGFGSFIGSGYLHEITETASTIPGGRGNRVTGFEAFAAGAYAEAAHNNTFVWNDGSGASDDSGDLDDRFSSGTSDGTSGVTGSNTFHVKATGGVRMVTAADNSQVAYIPDGSAGWSNTSTRTVKTNVEPVEPEAALSGVESLEVATWEYEDGDDEGAGVTHVGPMAEDFHDAFDVGDSEQTINSINADGVAFAAIQGLSERLERKDERIDELERENEQLRERLAEIEAHVGLTGETEN